MTNRIKLQIIEDLSKTVSLFDVKLEETQNKSFKYYPDWLKSNIYALLDPSVIYLEDSSKFESTNEISW